MGFSLGGLIGGGLGFLVGGPAGAAVGASIGGGLDAQNASSNAADAQVSAANNASANSLQAARESNALQKEMFDKQVELQSPFRQAGLTGQNRLMDLLGLSGNTGAQGYGSANEKFSMGDFTADPGYQFRLQQGQQALDRSASARGGMFSGRAAKDLMNYGQGAASQEYGNVYNRKFNEFQTNRANTLNPLQSLSGMAQTSSNTLGNAASNYGTNVGNTLTSTAGMVGNNMKAAGDARGSGYLGQVNSMNNAIGSGIGAYNNYNYMNKLFPQSSNSSFGYVPSNANTMIEMQPGGGY
jgi:hypothetical protein